MVKTHSTCRYKLNDDFYAYEMWQHLTKLHTKVNSIIIINGGMAVILGEGLYLSAIYNHLIYISRLSVLAIVAIRNIEERIKVDLLQISFQRDHWHSLFVLLQLCKQSAPIHDFDYPASLHTTEKMTNIIFTSLTRYFPGSVLKGRFTTLS